MRIWLDDERPKPSKYDVSTAYADEAIRLLRQHGDSVVEISLDCDLGAGHGTGYSVALWISEQWLYGNLASLTVRCHSANPVERDAVSLLVERTRERVASGDLFAK